MLRHLRDDVIAAVAASHRHTLNGKIVAFTSACGENDFVGRTADKISHTLAGRIHSLASRLTIPMTAGRITKVFRKIRRNCASDFRIDGSGPVVVQVNRRVEDHRSYES